MDDVLLVITEYEALNVQRRVVVLISVVTNLRAHSALHQCQGSDICRYTPVSRTRTPFHPRAESGSYCSSIVSRCSCDRANVLVHKHVITLSGFSQVRTTAGIS